MASLVNVIGNEGMDMYETCLWNVELDSLKINKVLEKFEERCVPARNLRKVCFLKREQLPMDLLIVI